jgi:hypothetical protein
MNMKLYAHPATLKRMSPNLVIKGDIVLFQSNLVSLRMLFIVSVISYEHSEYFVKAKQLGHCSDASARSWCLSDLGSTAGFWAVLSEAG